MPLWHGLFLVDVFISKKDAGHSAVSFVPTKSRQEGLIHPIYSNTYYVLYPV